MRMRELRKILILGNYETRLLVFFFTGPLNLLIITGARIIVFGL